MQYATKHGQIELQKNTNLCLEIQLSNKKLYFYEFMTKMSKFTIFDVIFIITKFEQNFQIMNIYDYYYVFFVKVKHFGVREYGRQKCSARNVMFQ